MSNSYLSLGDAIQAFLRANGLADEVKIQGVINRWGQLMGKPIATNTEKMWYKEGILYIKVATPIWRNELGMARTQIKIWSTENWEQI